MEKARGTNKYHSLLSSLSFPICTTNLSFLTCRGEDTPLGHSTRQIILLLAAFPQTDISIYMATQTNLVESIIQDLRAVMLECSTKDEEHFKECEQLLEKQLKFLSELLFLCSESAESKDNKDKALILRDALFETFRKVILQEYLKQELLAIQYVLVITR